MPTQQHYEALQVLRVGLFLAIFLFHTGWEIASMGGFGVEFFLVLSAFFLAKKCMGKSSSKLLPFQMLTHRIKRLSPLYYIALILSVAALWIVKKEFSTDIFFFIPYFQNYFWMTTDYQTDLPFLSHTWYLSLDISLFFIWIFVLRVLRFKTFMAQIKILFIIIILTIVYRIMMVCKVDREFLLSLNPLCYLDCFALGTLIFIFSQNRGGDCSITIC